MYEELSSYHSVTSHIIDKFIEIMIMMIIDLFQCVN